MGSGGNAQINKCGRFMNTTTYETPELTELGILNVDTLSMSGKGKGKGKGKGGTRVLRQEGGRKKDMHDYPPVCYKDEDCEIDPWTDDGASL